MCNNNETNSHNCICDILKVILLLQQGACQNDTCLETCDRGFLGQGATSFFNTRPVVLYTCSGGSTPLAMPISRDPAETTTGTIFRLEKLDNCCATFRVLTLTDDTYTATNSFFTINLDCICCIRCLNDTYVDTP
jgi:hypothetical protein